MNSEALFSRTAPLKLFFLAAIPGAVSMLASALYQTVDGVFVGHFLGSTAFAAVNLAMPFVIINFSLADLIGVGAAVPISICLGRQEKEEANNIFTCAVSMIVGTGVLIGAALFLSAPLVIRLMGADGEFAELAVQYPHLTDEDYIARLLRLLHNAGLDITIKEFNTLLALRRQLDQRLL